MIRHVVLSGLVHSNVQQRARKSAATLAHWVERHGVTGEERVQVVSQKVLPSAQEEVHTLATTGLQGHVAALVVVFEQQLVKAPRQRIRRPCTRGGTTKASLPIH